MRSLYSFFAHRRAIHLPLIILGGGLHLAIQLGIGATLFAFAFHLPWRAEIAHLLLALLALGAAYAAIAGLVPLVFLLRALRPHSGK